MVRGNYSTIRRGGQRAAAVEIPGYHYKKMAAAKLVFLRRIV